MNKSFLLALVASTSMWAGCSDDDAPADAGVSTDRGFVRDAGGADAAAPDSGIEPDCFPNPRVHREIINACTSAQFFDKMPVLPLLRPDGTLPPLP